LKKIQPDKKITKKVLAKPEYIMYNLTFRVEFKI